MNEPSIDAGQGLPRRIDTLLETRAQTRRHHEDRRKRVLQLLCAGTSQRDIASALGIKHADVCYCIGVIMRKAGVKTHAQLGVWASKEGLV